MRFKLVFVADAGQDIEDLVVNFSAPNWDAAATFSNAFQKQLGVKGASTVTYADKATGPTPATLSWRA